jgi:hypothetical protein
MQNSIDPKDYQDIKAYVEEFEQQGNGSRVHHLRLLINEIERLTPLAAIVESERLGVMVIK